MYVTSDLTSSERRLSLGWTIEQLKAKLEVVTGIPPESQTLLLYRANTGSSAEAGVELDNDSKLLQDYTPTAYSRLHVLDTRPASERLDLQNGPVEAFQLTDEQYDKRSDSVRAWKRQNQLGRFDTSANRNDAEASKQQVQERGIVVGARCKVSETKLGTVRYIGAVPEIANNSERVWVGVEYDEPVGKHEGNGYFKAQAKHGAFVKPEMVEIGDFSEEDYDEL